MKATKLLFLLTALCCLLNKSSKAQDDPKLGQYSNTNRFYLDTIDHIQGMQYYVPNKDKIKAYDSETGLPFTLTQTDTIYGGSVYFGSWKGKKGRWVELFLNKITTSHTTNSYVLLSDLKNIDKEVRTRADIDQEKNRQEGNKVVMWIALILFVLLILIIFFYGYINRYPECKKWFAARRIKTTELPGSSYNYTSTEPTTVYTGGKPGTAWVPVTKTGFTRSYRVDYCCKKCGHEWSEIERP